jgi:4-aminobutyrate aminotransferase-like enzyme
MTSTTDALSVTGHKPSPSTEGILELGRRYLNPGVGPAEPIVWDHARGSVVTDVDGKDYLDLASGTLITNIGHAHPKVVEAVARAAARSLAFYSAAHRDRALLAERLAAITPGDLQYSAFFNSGSEAVDAAVRLARLHTGASEVLSFRGAFHGRSYLSLSVSGLSRLRRDLGPALPNMLHAPYPSASDPDAGQWRQGLQEILDAESSGSVAAILVEPYQGAGGVIIPPADFLPGLRELADDLGADLIIDEVQSLYGRTGPMFASEHTGTVADILLMGKPVGNGYPMSVMTARPEVVAEIRPDQFSSTYGGNPGSCAAGLAVLDVFEEEGVLAHGAALIPIFEQRLTAMAERHACITEVRQQGLAIGIEVDVEGPTGSAALAKRIVTMLRAEGVLLNSPIGRNLNVLRLAPAVNMPIELATRSLDILDACLERA